MQNSFIDRVTKIKQANPTFGRVSIARIISDEDDEVFGNALLSKVRRVLETIAKNASQLEPEKENEVMSNESESDHQKPDFTEKPSKRIDVIKTIQILANRVKDHPKKSDYDKVVIKTDKPIAIMKAADFHFGGLDISYESLLQHVKFLMETDNFYLQLFGDDINLMVMHKTVGARHDVLTPSEQIHWLESWVHDMFEKGKLISMGWGNHTDEFTERVAGFGIVSMIEKYNVPYFRGLGYLDLKLVNSMGNEFTYPMAFAHSARFNSMINPTQGNKKMEMMHAHYFGVDKPLAREYITAHTHYPAFSMEGCLPNERIYYIKCGTFKNDCVYSQRYFGQGRIGIPTVVYHPDRFEHICFPTPFEAYRYMNGKDWKG
jgi:hypothetical protein